MLHHLVLLNFIKILHEQFLLLSPTTLAKTDIPVPRSTGCHACLVAKSQHKKVKHLVSALKDFLTKNGTNVAMDLWVPRNAPSLFIAGEKEALIKVVTLDKCIALRC